MKRIELGRTGIKVPNWCLGTMTWGRQTDEADGHRQIDMALERGIDFLDTAEMYPVNPPKAETVGDTETIIGNWIRKTGRRDEMTIATKMLGPSEMVRNGAPITPDALRAALDGSLRRLGTDRVDLYQLHWPNRGSYHFRQIWEYDPTGQDRVAAQDHFAEIMSALKDLAAAGKIRAFGLSNDTAWGVCQWQKAAEAQGGPRVATIQNEYSLLCRHFDSDLAEACHHEEVTLLAYSPLACGLLSGKYGDGVIPEGSRRSINPELNGRVTDRLAPALDAYLDIARRYGIDPVHMAFAWVTTRPVPSIPIFGATTVQQMEHALDGLETEIPDDVLAEIEAAHRAHPMPF
ncbi:aldo/keto reductase [Palleronia abyssalis]|uniref:General stress protein 69 n=1 Tax=Palleronia abyssalis TaxID=1501240 RepID=A0A2R8BYJ7_9RHOB|nr:aldo/keto reductase [Palleronia abyssalis]SPJ25241.1 General stress protein 69 [Palleronia abyssalis]